MDAHLRFSEDNEMSKWLAQAQEFSAVALHDLEQPLFISDEACLWDIFVGDQAELIERCACHYGVRITSGQFSLPFWQLLKFLEENRKR